MYDDSQAAYEETSTTISRLRRKFPIDTIFTLLTKWNAIDPIYIFGNLPDVPAQDVGKEISIQSKLHTKANVALPIVVIE